MSELKEMVLLDKAEQAIIQAKSIDEIKDIMDKAEVIRLYAKKAQKGLLIQNRAAEIKLMAERQAGVWLKKDGPKEGRPKKGTTMVPLKLKDLGVSKNESSRWQAVASLPDGAFKKHMAEIKESNKELTTVGVIKLAKVLHRGEKIDAQRENIKKLSKPTGLFDIIVVDPPWEFHREYNPEHGRSVGDYPTMSVDEIKKIKLPSKKDCVLWLWVTNMDIRNGFEILDSWGFEYKNILTWDKEIIGIGSYLRNQTEHCLMAIKGKPLLDLTNQPTIIREKRREHSRKPEAFYNLVNSLCIGEKLDYFSRSERKGWASYGDEATKF